jgi:hypothetical protein
MPLQRQRVAKLFMETAKKYPDDERPRYRNARLAILERELQKRFAVRLMDENIPFVRERYYPGQSDKKIDFKIFDVLEMHVEIEWEAANTDGFATRTFEDMEKLKHLPSGRWAMFLALNVGDKYQLPKRVTLTHDPSKFAKSPRKGRPTVLSRKWSQSKDTDLLRCNPSFWSWPIKIANRGPHVVTVLACYGRRTENGWKPS